MIPQRKEQPLSLEVPKNGTEASAAKPLVCTLLRVEMQRGETEKQAAQRVAKEMLAVFRGYRSS